MKFFTLLVSLVCAEEIAIRLQPHVNPEVYAKTHNCQYLSNVAGLSNYYLLECPSDSTLHANAARDAPAVWWQVQEKRQVLQ